MNTNKKMAASLAAIVGLGAAAMGVPSAQAQAPIPPVHPGHAERHPELRRALRSLEKTEAELRASARDFGGHRAKAADLCQQAEQEIQQALQYDKN